jgi:hypothetical protein
MPVSSKETEKMRITVKDSTPERAREFACTLATALRRPVFKRNTDQIDPNDTVLEFNTKYKELETVQDVIEGTAEQLGIQVWFWTYKKSIRRSLV